MLKLHTAVFLCWLAPGLYMFYVDLLQICGMPDREKKDRRIRTEPGKTPSWQLMLGNTHLPTPNSSRNPNVATTPK